MRRDRSNAITDRTVETLRALANPTRFRIVATLSAWKDGTSLQLQEELGISQSTLFEHLAALRKANVIQNSGGRSGAALSWCVNPDAVKFLASMLDQIGSDATEWQVVHAHDGLRVRRASPEDAEAISAIYNQGIEDKVATLETTTRTGAERAEWMAAKGDRYPVLVAVDDENEVCGWASLNQFSPRPAYDHVADISVYVARDRRGRGIGDLLLTALEKQARAIGFHKLVLAAFPTNAPGMRLYQRQGFVTVGIYHEQGMLDGKWVDTIVMEKLLA
jgi:L-amino acid N-acyltransferase YncA/DNA-binding MarR family transcriptional regulator